MEVKFTFSKEETKQMCEQKAERMMPAPKGYGYAACSTSWGETTVELVKVDASETAEIAACLEPMPPVSVPVLSDIEF